jgi:glycosyltransferase involved in cell wall biosynthesis
MKKSYMRVLIVNASDIDGGAARAAYRLHKALLNESIDSKMIVQFKKSDDYTVLGPQTKMQKALCKLRPILDNLPVKLYKNRTKTLFSPSWLRFSGIASKINEINPDIVHLHWITGGMMSIEDINKIKAPVIWSLHDNWAFTGGCHIKWECDNYKNSCGFCPRLGSNKENDLSRKVWNRKKRIFDVKKMTIVGLSRWIHKCSKDSCLLKSHININLPNLIDVNIFKPFDKQKSRELWNLSSKKRLILFGAMGATSDIRKGFKELIRALELIKSDAIEFVVFGSSEPINAPNFRFKVNYLGHLHDDISLVTLYSAVDVMVVPSLQENLSNVIMESLACATPVVAFNVGGNSDMIEHLKSGYLAKTFDSEDLAKGIDWIINNPKYEELCEHARSKIIREFDSAIVTKKYIALYQDVLKSK